MVKNEIEINTGSKKSSFRKKKEKRKNVFRTNINTKRIKNEDKGTY